MSEEYKSVLSGGLSLKGGLFKKKKKKKRKLEEADKLHEESTNSGNDGAGTNSTEAAGGDDNGEEAETSKEADTRLTPSQQRYKEKQEQREVSPKVLGVLQILGRGSCFDDVAQLSGMSVSSVHLFFHRFCKRFAAELWSTWVKLSVGEDLKDLMKIYEVLGYPDAMASMDCTHVAWGRCPFSSAGLYSGKEKFPSVVYDYHQPQPTYPGSRNDKTISRFYSASNRVWKEEPYFSQEFNLRSKDGVLKTYKGAYLLIDGGYHKVKRIRNFVAKTHRERVEDFNALLASMTEHNDIPRCSAAGNG